MVAMETGHFLKTLNDASLASLGFLMRKVLRCIICKNPLWVLSCKVTPLRCRTIPLPSPGNAPTDLGRLKSTTTTSELNQSRSGRPLNLPMLCYYVLYTLSSLTYEYSSTTFFQAIGAVDRCTKRNTFAGARRS